MEVMSEYLPERAVRHPAPGWLGRATPQSWPREQSDGFRVLRRSARLSEALERPVSVNNLLQLGSKHKRLFAYLCEVSLIGGVRGVSVLLRLHNVSDSMRLARYELSVLYSRQ